MLDVADVERFRNNVYLWQLPLTLNREGAILHSQEETVDSRVLS